MNKQSQIRCTSFPCLPFQRCAYPLIPGMWCPSDPCLPQLYTITAFRPLLEYDLFACPVRSYVILPGQRHWLLTIHPQRILCKYLFPASSFIFIIVFLVIINYYPLELHRWFYECFFQIRARCNNYSKAVNWAILKVSRCRKLYWKKTDFNQSKAHPIEKMGGQALKSAWTETGSQRSIQRASLI